MFDIEVDTPSITQVRHIESDAAVVIWHKTNKVEVTPGFNSTCPLDLDDREALDALVTSAREWLAAIHGRPIITHHRGR